MFEITKVIVNTAGNVVNSISLGFIQATREEVITSIARNFHRLAVTDNLRYKVLGSDYTCQYQFKSVVVHTSANLARFIDVAISENIADANAYIHELNAAVRISNKRNYRKRDANVIKAINPKDYLMGDGSRATVLTVDNYIVVK